VNCCSTLKLLNCAVHIRTERFGKCSHVLRFLMRIAWKKNKIKLFSICLYFGDIICLECRLGSKECTGAGDMLKIS
jgi:hypothetical protein